jgi:hypothetical protein
MDVTGKTASFKLPEAIGAGIILVRPATEHTKEFQAAVLKLEAEHPDWRDGTNVIEALKLVLPIFAEHIVVGWKNLNDMHGKPAEFSTENCLALLTEMVEQAPDIFNELTSFAADLSNFRKKPLTVESTTKTTKKS